MKIENIEIKGFGKLTNLKIKLNSGLNIIIGSNEAGKSTLQLFIKGMFYDLKGGRVAKDGVLPELKKYKPWQGNSYGGFMEYTLSSGERIRIERDFDNGTVKIFDGLYNNITNSFETSKKTGPLFAEKHLGINELCFEKTAFIKQMDVKIGSEGIKELQSKLMNLSQTGFEDVSLKNAQAALSQALKTYVGTDKTSTKPLDKIIHRLESLKKQKQELILKRDTLMDVYSSLNKAKKSHAMLTDKLAFLTRIETLAFFKTARRSAEKLLDMLNEPFGSVSKKDNLLANASKCFDNLAKFSRRTGTTQAEGPNSLKNMQASDYLPVFSEEDIARISKDFYEALELAEQNIKTRNEINSCKGKIADLESRSAHLKAFGSMESDIDARLVKISKECEALKSSLNLKNLEQFNDRETLLRSKKRNASIGAAVTAVAALLSGVFGIIAAPWKNATAAVNITGSLSPSPLGYVLLAASLVSLVLSLAFMYIRFNTSKNIALLARKKNSLMSQQQDNIAKIAQYEAMLKNTFASVKAESLQDFLHLKAMYDSMIHNIVELNMTVNTLESRLNTNERKFAALKSSIAAVLDKLCLSDNLDNMYKEIKTDYEAADIKTAEFDSLLEALNPSGRISAEKFTTISVAAFEKPNGVRNADILKMIHDVRLDISEKLTQTALKIKEYETVLQTSGLEEDSIQKIDEEISELEEKKNELDDTGKALKTALDLLSEAGSELQRDFAPLLNQKMSNIISTITGGRYKELKADESLGLKTYSPESGNILDYHLLSGGTIDQFYLAMRLAVAQLITANSEPLPLIMDEIFAQFDDERTKNALSYIDALAKHTQILLFTCKKRELEIALKVCANPVNIIELDDIGQNYIKIIS